MVLLQTLHHSLLVIQRILNGNTQVFFQTITNLVQTILWPAANYVTTTIMEIINKQTRSRKCEVISGKHLISPIRLWSSYRFEQVDVRAIKFGMLPCYVSFENKPRRDGKQSGASPQFNIWSLSNWRNKKWMAKTTEKSKSTWPEQCPLTACKCNVHSSLI